MGHESGRPGLGWTSLLFLKTSAVMKSKTLRAINKGLLKATYNYALVQRAITLKEVAAGLSLQGNLHVSGFDSYHTVPQKSEGLWCPVRACSAHKSAKHSAV